MDLQHTPPDDLRLQFDKFGTTFESSKRVIIGTNPSCGGVRWDTVRVVATICASPAPVAVAHACDGVAVAVVAAGYVLHDPSRSCLASVSYNTHGLDSALYASRGAFEEVEGRVPVVAVEVVVRRSPRRPLKAHEASRKC